MKSFSWSRIIPSDGRMDGRTDRQKNMTKLIVAFRNFSQARETEGRTFNELPVGITVDFLRRNICKYPNLNSAVIRSKYWRITLTGRCLRPNLYDMVVRG
jgi:hypothetical protein